MTGYLAGTAQRGRCARNPARRRPLEQPDARSPDALGRARLRSLQPHAGGYRFLTTDVTMAQRRRYTYRGSRRLVKDYEQLPEVVAGLHLLDIVCLFLQRALAVLG